MKSAIFASTALSVVIAIPVCAQQLTTPAPTAPAKPTPAEAAAPSTSAPAVGEIVVTAQRKEQIIQKVPIAVTQINPTTIQRLHLLTIDKVAIVTPGLLFDRGFGIAQTYIRGVGAQNAFGIGLEAPVATYVDGAYFSRGPGGTLDTFDLASVEVLKGPQGTLYGRNASGGAILINTANPTHTLEESATVEAGSYGHVLIDGMVNIPASDNLAFRFSGRYRDGDDYLYNIVNHEHVGGKQSVDLRGKAKWDALPGLSAILEADYHHETGHAQPSGRQEASPPICVGCALGGVYQTTDFHQVTEDYKRTEPGHGYNINLNLKYDIGKLEIRSITSHRYLSVDISDDQDHTSLPLLVLNAVYGGATWTEDLQVNSSYKGWFNFLAGLQYISDDAFVNARIFGLALGLPYVNDGTIPANHAEGDQQVSTNSYAGFAEVYIKPIDRLTLTLGGRYSKDDRSISTQLNAFAAPIFFPGGPNQFSQSASYSKFTPRAVVDYDAGLVNFYASFTQGFKAGGFAAPSFSPQVLPIKPETIDSYEAGVKFVSDDRRTRASLAGFHYNYQNMQVSIINTVTVSQLITNAASAYGDGVELEVSHQALRWLSISGGGSWLDARFNKYPNAPVYVPVTNASGAVTGISLSSTDLSGARLPRAPKWTAFAVVTAEAPIIGGWTGRFTTNLHYTSDYDFTPGAGGPLQTDKQPSSFLMDLSADVEPANGRLQIGFYINNVTNKQYYTNRGIGTLGIDALPAPPRTVGVRLTAKF